MARDFCRWKAEGGEQSGVSRPGVVCACMLSPYSTHDPAPADQSTDGLSAGGVGDILSDASRPLFTRYGAMFALRNRGGDECVAQLGRALVEDTSSALLRHEVAYVGRSGLINPGVGTFPDFVRRSGTHHAYALCGMMGNGGASHVRGAPQTRSNVVLLTLGYCIITAHDRYVLGQMQSPAALPSLEVSGTLQRRVV